MMIGFRRLKEKHHGSCQYEVIDGFTYLGVVRRISPSLHLWRWNYDEASMPEEIGQALAPLLLGAHKQKDLFAKLEALFASDDLPQVVDDYLFWRQYTHFHNDDRIAALKEVLALPISTYGNRACPLELVQKLRSGWAKSDILNIGYWNYHTPESWDREANSDYRLVRPGPGVDRLLRLDEERPWE